MKPKDDRAKRIAKEAKRRAQASARQIPAAVHGDKKPRSERWPASGPRLPLPLDPTLHAVLETRGWVRYDTCDEGASDSYDWVASQPSVPDGEDCYGWPTHITVTHPDCDDRAWCSCKEARYDVTYAQVDDRGGTSKDYETAGDLIAELDAIEVYRAGQPAPPGAVSRHR